MRWKCFWRQWRGLSSEEVSFITIASNRAEERGIYWRLVHQIGANKKPVRRIHSRVWPSSLEGRRSYRHRWFPVNLVTVTAHHNYRLTTIAQWLNICTRTTSSKSTLAFYDRGPSESYGGKVRDTVAIRFFCIKAPEGPLKLRTPSHWLSIDEAVRKRINGPFIVRGFHPCPLVNEFAKLGIFCQAAWPYGLIDMVAAVQQMIFLPVWSRPRWGWITCTKLILIFARVLSEISTTIISFVWSVEWKIKWNKNSQGAYLSEMKLRIRLA